MVVKRRFHLLKNHPRLALKYFTMFRQDIPRGINFTLRRLLWDLQVDYGLFEDITLPPFMHTLHITRRCNLRCKMCWQWGNARYFTEKNALLGEELSTNEWKDIIDKLAHYKPNIILTGGEPLLREDLLEIVAHVKRRGLTCEVQTNGTLIFEEVAEKLVEVGLDGIIFSVLGPNSSIHDGETGVSRSFEAAVEGVKSLVKFRRKKTLPMIRFNCPILQSNYRHFCEMVDLAEELKIDVLQFSHSDFLTEEVVDAHEVEWAKLFGPSGRKSWRSCCCHHETDKINVTELLEETSKVKGRQLKTNLYVEFRPDFSPREIQEYYTNMAWVPKGSKCLAAFALAGVECNGLLNLCATDYAAGNLKLHSVEELLRDKKFRKFRSTMLRMAKQGKFLPGCCRCFRMIGRRTWQVARL